MTSATVSIFSYNIYNTNIKLSKEDISDKNKKKTYEEDKNGLNRSTLFPYTTLFRSNH